MKFKVLHRWILSKGYKFLVRLFLGADLGDTESGCKFFKREKIASPIPINFLVVMLLITAFLYNVFLTARYQAPRYFKPLILIWETFLPIFIFSLLPLINFEFLKKEKSKKIALNIVSVFVVIILISYYLIYMWSAYSNSFSYVLA